ncbi:hypothetical protein As57867_024829, partial [Aphanomyces stellatus]
MEVVIDKINMGIPTKTSTCMQVLPALSTMAVVNVGLSFPAFGWSFATIYSLTHPSSTVVLRHKFLYWCETLFVINYTAGFVGLVALVIFGIRLKLQFECIDSTWGIVVWVTNFLLVLLIGIQWVIFDQFRTHQKQQLGAPNELEHVGSWKLRRWLSALIGKKAKSNSELRVNLYAAVKRERTVEVEALLAKAMQGLASEGERNMFFWTLYTTPPMVLSSNIVLFYKQLLLVEKEMKGEGNNSNKMLKKEDEDVEERTCELKMKKDPSEAKTIEKNCACEI